MVLFEELKTTIPSEHKHFPIGTPYVDRFYDVIPAGTSNTLSHVRMKHCLEHLKHPPTPEPTKRIDSWLNPDVEQTRIFHAQVNDEQLIKARDMTHGIISKDRTRIKELIRPEEPSDFTTLIQAKQEAVYESSKRKPLGHVPEPDLPENIDPLETVFGLPNKKGDRAADLLNPRVSRADILRREAEDRKHYLVSHKHLIAGEQAHRDYKQPPYDPSESFGIKTYVDGRGIKVRKALTWSPPAGITPVMSQRQFDFNERYGYKLGRVRDPIADTMNVPPDHTFGLPSIRGEMTVGQLLHGRVPRQLVTLPFDNEPNGSEEICVNYEDRLHKLLPVIHHALSVEGFWKGSEIAAVLCNKANGADLLPLQQARDLYDHFNVPLDEELTEQLFDAIMVPAPEEIRKQSTEAYERSKTEEITSDRTRYKAEYIPWAVDWRLMSLFLDWKRQCLDMLQLKKCGCVGEEHVKQQKNEDAAAVKRRIRRAIDANVLTHTLSSQDYAGDLNGWINTDCWKRLGIPPVEKNRPVPKVRGFRDYRNYGDEPTVASLVQPNIYTEYGLSQRDLLMLRTKEEVQKLMDDCGLSAKYNLPVNFDSIWKCAVEIDKSLLEEKASKTGEQVSLQAFKQAMFGQRRKEIARVVEEELAAQCCF